MFWEQLSAMRFRRALLIFCTLLITVLLYVLHQCAHHRPKPVPDADKKDSSEASRNRFYIAVVVCKQRLQETFVMIKSALLFNNSNDILHFIILSEEHLREAFQEKLRDWQDLLNIKFDFELLPLRFPQNSETEWRSLFKPCAAQRLFLPSLLHSVESLLYVDTDILFLSPIADIWQFFDRFNDSQIAALTPEHEDANIGWYNRFARHPYYGALGVNSGVMLMNLTRMRQFGWEAHVLPIHREYKLRITWGDQDLINILFYYNPEKLYVMPCEYNYRPDHCMYMSICNVSAEGIKIIHGNRGYFHSDKQPLFRAIYETIERFPLGTNPYFNFLVPLREALEDPKVAESNCGKVSKEALQFAEKKFINDYYYEPVK